MCTNHSKLLTTFANIDKIDIFLKNLTCCQHKSNRLSCTVGEQVGTPRWRLEGSDTSYYLEDPVLERSEFPATAEWERISGAGPSTPAVEIAITCYKTASPSDHTFFSFSECPKIIFQNWTFFKMSKNDPKNFATSARNTPLPLFLRLLQRPTAVYCVVTIVVHNIDGHCDALAPPTTTCPPPAQPHHRVRGIAGGVLTPLIRLSSDVRQYGARILLGNSIL